MPGPTIVKRGAQAGDTPTIGRRGETVRQSPVSRAHREAEERVAGAYEEIEARYGANRFTRTRGGEMRIRDRPATPVSDAYVVVMRPRSAVPGISLEPLVIAKEQQERGAWLQAEAERAVSLESSLERDVQMGIYYEQMEEYNRQLREYEAARAEERARDEEAQRYGYPTYEALQQAIYEEKLIRHLNELGAELTEIQLEAQRAARESIPYPDYAPSLAAQAARVADLQRGIEATYRIDIGGGIPDYVAAVDTVMQQRATVPVSVESESTTTPTLLGWNVVAVKQPTMDVDPATVLYGPVPEDPIGQILYWHAPIVDRFRADTTLTGPAVDLGIAAYQASRVGRRDPIVEHLAIATVREPTRPISALVEIPGELVATGVALPGIASYYMSRPEAIPEVPGKIIGGLTAELVKDPIGAMVKTGALTVATGPVAGAVGRAAGPITRPIVRELRSPTVDSIRLWAGDVAPPLDIAGGWLPSESMIETGMPAVRAIRRGETPLVTSRSFASRYPSRAGTIVEIEPGKLIDAKYAAQYKFRASTGLAGQEPIPPGNLYPPDVMEGIPRGWASLATGVTPGEAAPSFVGGWLPSESMIETGMPAVRAIRRGETPLVTSRSFASRYPSRAGTIVEIEPGKLIDAKYAAQYKFRASTGLAGQEPIPPGNLYPPDVMEGIPSSWVVSGEPVYAGLPIRISRSVTSAAPGSKTAHLRVRYSAQQSVRPDFGVLPRAIVTPLSRTGSTIRPASVITTRSVTHLDTRTDRDTRPIGVLDLSTTSVQDLSEIVVSDSGIKTVPVQTTMLDLVPVTVTVPDVTLRPDTPVRPPRLTPPRPPVRPPRITPPRPPIRPLLSDEPRRRPRLPWEEWYVHYREAPVPAAGLEGAYLSLPDAAPVPGKLIKNVERITIGPAPARTVKPVLVRGKSPGRIKLGWW